MRDVLSRARTQNGAKLSSGGGPVARVVASIERGRDRPKSPRGLKAVPHVVARSARWELNLDTCRGFVSIYWYSRNKSFFVKLTILFMSPKPTAAQKKPPGAALFALLKPYPHFDAMLVVLTIAPNGR